MVLSYSTMSVFVKGSPAPSRNRVDAEQVMEADLLRKWTPVPSGTFSGSTPDGYGVIWH